ncbi:MAG: hypothetical protein DRI69_03315 [Bacteroidetes bacterium]|nr:MAG: hypothetical protein DRI69_03315 [Bacteroidota bacterium]
MISTHRIKNQWYWAMMFALALVVLVQSDPYAQNDYVMWRDSSLTIGTVLIHARNSGYEVDFRCDTCKNMESVSAYSALAVRRRRGEVLRSVESIRPNEHSRTWLKEIESGELVLFGHKASDSYFILSAGDIEEVPEAFGDIKRLFASHLDTMRVFPENRSTYKHGSSTLKRLVRYANEQTYQRFPISGFSAGVFTSAKALSFAGDNEGQESYVRNDKTYWSFGYGVFASHDMPIKTDGRITWQNELRLINNILANDNSYAHFQNAIEIYSLFAQYRTGIKLIDVKRTYSPYVQLGVGINLLLYNDDTFLRLVENADGFDIDFGEIENFSDISFLPFIAGGVEIPIGKKILSCEIGTEFEKYGNLDYVWTFYLSVGINLN